MPTPFTPVTSLVSTGSFPSGRPLASLRQLPLILAWMLGPRILHGLEADSFPSPSRHRCLRRRPWSMQVSSLVDIQHALGFSNDLRQPFVVASVNFRLLPSRAVETPEARRSFDGRQGLASVAAGCRY